MHPRPRPGLSTRHGRQWRCVRGARRRATVAAAGEKGGAGVERGTARCAAAGSGRGGRAAGGGCRSLGKLVA